MSGSEYHAASTEEMDSVLDLRGYQLAHYHDLGSQSPTSGKISSLVTEIAMSLNPTISCVQASGE